MTKEKQVLTLGCKKIKYQNLWRIYLFIHEHFIPKKTLKENSIFYQYWKKLPQIIKELIS